jgi:PKD repeat protein
MKQFLTFLTLCMSLANVMAQDVSPLIKQYLLDNHKALHLSKTEATSDWHLSDQYLTKHNQVTQAYVQQQVNGLNLYNAISSAAVKNGSVVVFNSGFSPNAAQRANVTPGMQQWNARQAIVKAAELLNIPLVNLKSVEENTTAGKTSIFSADGDVKGPIKVSLLYKETPTEIRLAWNVEIQANSDWWHIRIDAMTGAMLDKGNYTVYCHFSPTGEHSCTTEQHRPNTKALKNSNTQTLKHSNTQASAYRIFPFPTESPSHGSRVLVSDPADPIASPFGWHDTDGVDGADYSITRGNNVYASEDRDDDNVPGYSPDGGANLLFDFPYNPGLTPTAWEDVAITNLFYTNNFIHDMTYHHGFDEVAGNFQEYNYSAGGKGDDAVQADAQDGSGTNNANFSTPPDGSSGRMQMYIWTGGSGGNSLIVNAPAVIAGSYDAPVATFGPVVTTPINGDVALIEDSTPPTANGCEPIVNAAQLNGKIVLIDRGSCLYEVKVQAAQDAGAIAVIVVNFSAGDPFSMIGSSTTINIPSVMIAKADGLKIRQQLVNGVVNITIPPTNGSERDSDLDNGVIAHEFGHGISNRLTGGPSNTGCLNNEEQMGEGWSDFYALITTMRPNDTRTTARPIGTYALGEGLNGDGIRAKVYSTNMSVNNYTYGDLPGTAGFVHNIGELWATMLWDLTWDLIDQYGFEPNLMASTGGNNIAQRLVTDGFKLQKCSPGFVDGRDAILQADQLNYNGANQCLIWKAFARRGLGFSASQGLSSSFNDGVEAFDVSPLCQVAVAAPIAAFTVDRTSSCLEQAYFQFTNQSQNLAQYFSWNFGDGNTSTEQNPAHTYTANGLYTVTLTVTNNIGSNTLSNTNYITVQELPAPSVAGVTVCTGQSASLTVTPGSANNTAEWTDVNGNILFTGTTFNTPALTATTTYAVNEAGKAPVQKVGPPNFGTGSNHDSQNIRKILFTAEKSFAIRTVLVRAQGEGNREIRLYDESNNVIATRTVNIPNGDSRITLNFEIPGPGQYALGAGPNINLFRNSQGTTYPFTINDLVTIVSSDGQGAAYYYFYDWEVQETPCRSASTNVTVTVIPGVSPVADFSSIKNGLTVTFADLSSGSPTTWLWNFGDGTTSTLPNPTHTYTAVGTYTVELTVSNGTCSDNFTQTVDFTTGTDPLDQDQFTVQLSPNPATGSVNVTLLGLPGSRNVQIGLYSVDGRLLQSRVYDTVQSAVIPLDLKGLAAGLYVVKVEAAAGLVVNKLMVH